MPSVSIGKHNPALEADFVELNKALSLRLMFRCREEESEKGKEHGPCVRAEVTRGIGGRSNFKGNRTLGGFRGGEGWGCRPESLRAAQVMSPGMRGR